VRLGFQFCIPPFEARSEAEALSKYGVVPEYFLTKKYSTALKVRRLLREFCDNGHFVRPWYGLELSNARMRPGSNPGLPRAPSRLFARVLGGLRTGFLWVFPLRIACVFLHVERGRILSEYGVVPRIIYFVSSSATLRKLLGNGQKWATTLHYYLCFATVKV
jgi:hypothetical protein